MLHSDFEKYAAVQKSEINEKVDNVGETLWHEWYHESIVFLANHMANVLTNKTKQHRKKHTT